ncbi:MAG TPA: hypothetical protein VH641_14405 [Streptosporangiaceae bacterium]|jgi:hypothetical protein
MGDRRDPGDQATCDQLEAEFPGARVWVVYRAVGGKLWCAALPGDPVGSVSGLTPDQLRDELRTGIAARERRQPPGRPPEDQLAARAGA